MPQEGSHIFKSAQMNGGPMDGEWIKINVLQISHMEPDAPFIELNMNNGDKLKVRWPVQLLEVENFGDFD